MPAPWTVEVVENDVRPGGASLFMMRSPEDGEFPNRGVYLEVVKNERIVFTDAYTEYTARVRHWSVADREAHEKMGFHQGWVICAEQLAALVEVA